LSASDIEIGLKAGHSVRGAVKHVIFAASTVSLAVLLHLQQRDLPVAQHSQD
jgi:pyrimidine operon attenuation protein/uracil phosphoribosyltransferase